MLANKESASTRSAISVPQGCWGTEFSVGTGGPILGYFCSAGMTLFFKWFLRCRASRKSKYKLGPGTFYDNPEKLIAHGMVKEVPRKSANDDPRRRYYRMTGVGRKLLLAEVSRLDIAVRKAKVRLRGAKARRPFCRTMNSVLVTAMR